MSSYILGIGGYDRKYDVGLSEHDKHRGRTRGENEALSHGILGYSQFSETNMGPQARRRATTQLVGRLSGGGQYFSEAPSINEAIIACFSLLVLPTSFPNVFLHPVYMLSCVFFPPHS